MGVGGVEGYRGMAWTFSLDKHKVLEVAGGDGCTKM